jgi:signal transduction histidine kinase
MPPAALALERARHAALLTRDGLVHVLVGADPAPSWHWRASWQRRVAYGALALAVVVMTVLPGVFRPEGSLSVAAVGAALLLAVRYPLMGWRISWLAVMATLAWGQGALHWDPLQVGALVVLFCAAGVRHQRPVLWWMWGLSLLPYLLWGLLRHIDPLAELLVIIASTAMTIAVDSAGSRRRAQVALTAQTERTQLEQARRTVLEERARIARELHDVVAHHMSLMAVRAETAPYRLDGLPEPVRAEFESLSAAARDALADMRRVLGVLRQDQPTARAPQPQLADVAELIDTARAAGVRIDASLPADLDQVPAGVGVCGYRIVQESLSNASQHSPGAAVTVSVEQNGDAILLRIANGPTESAVAGHGAGHGLAGMRERVALLGGSLLAGPAPGGGFVVSSLLPLGEGAPDAPGPAALRPPAAHLVTDAPDQDPQQADQWQVA